MTLTDLTLPVPDVRLQPVDLSPEPGSLQSAPVIGHVVVGHAEGLERARAVGKAGAQGAGLALQFFKPAAAAAAASGGRGLDQVGLVGGEAAGAGAAAAAAGAIAAALGSAR